MGWRKCASYSDVSFGAGYGFNRSLSSANSKDRRLSWRKGTDCPFLIAVFPVPLLNSAGKTSCIHRTVINLLLISSPSIFLMTLLLCHFSQMCNVWSSFAMSNTRLEAKFYYVWSLSVPSPFTPRISCLVWMVQVLHSSLYIFYHYFIIIYLI